MAARWWGNSRGVKDFGIRQKLSVLLGSLAAPALILIDEAFDGSDAASAEPQAHGSRRRGVLQATYALDAIERCTDLAVLHDGRRGEAWDLAALQALREHRVWKRKPPWL